MTQNRPDEERSSPEREGDTVDAPNHREVGAAVAAADDDNDADDADNADNVHQGWQRRSEEQQLENRQLYAEVEQGRESIWKQIIKNLQSENALLKQHIQDLTVAADRRQERDDARFLRLEATGATFETLFGALQISHAEEIAGLRREIAELTQTNERLQRERAESEQQIQDLNREIDELNQQLQN